MATDVKASAYLRKHGVAVDRDRLIEGQRAYIEALERALTDLCDHCQKLGSDQGLRALVDKGQTLVAQGYAEYRRGQ
jgi:hypothetical protein